MRIRVTDMKVDPRDSRQQMGDGYSNHNQNTRAKEQKLLKV